MFGRKKPPREPSVPMHGQDMPHEPHRRRRPRGRRRFSLLATVLSIIGAVTVAVLLLRFALIPVLVSMNGLFGGAR